MVKMYDLPTVMRLFILLSTTLSGLKQSEFDHLRRTLITCYGYQEIATLLNLQDARLFKMRDKKMDWNKIKNEFRLINENVKIDVPEDIHYVFGGMAPISVRLLERFIERRGFHANVNLINLLPGRSLTPPAKAEADFFAPSMRPKKILVYFLGGVTFAEIAAIRYLNQSDKFRDKVRFVIATTSIINGNKCIHQMRTT